MLFTSARAYFTVDTRTKTFESARPLPHALAHELRNFDAGDPLGACERVFVYSNHEGRLCGYDGPSLSVGDLVELDAPELESTRLYLCAVIGFQDVTARIADFRRVRVDQPSGGGTYRAPVWDYATEQRGSLDSWRVWLDDAVRLGEQEQPGDT